MFDDFVLFKRNYVLLIIYISPSKSESTITSLLSQCNLKKPPISSYVYLSLYYGAGSFYKLSYINNDYLLLLFVLGFDIL